MRTMTRTLLTLTVAALMAAPVMAAQKQKDKKPREGRQHKNKAQFQAVTSLLKDIELTEEQKAKVAELQKEFGPKLAAIRAKTNEILTKEQQTARREAFKAAKESGKKTADISKTLNLTDEQKKKMEEVGKERKELMQEIKEKLLPLLTAEQKAKLPSRATGQHRKKAAGGAKGKGKHKKAEQ